MWLIISQGQHKIKLNECGKFSRDGFVEVRLGFDWVSFRHGFIGLGWKKESQNLIKVEVWFNLSRLDWVKVRFG